MSWQLHHEGSQLLKSLCTAHQPAAVGSDTDFRVCVKGYLPGAAPPARGAEVIPVLCNTSDLSPHTMK